MDRHLSTDLRLERIDNRALSLYRVAADRKRYVVAGRSRRREDFVAITGRDNLGQAIIVRLLTPRGELAPLGHPNYGARLHEVIGQPNTPTTRNLARLFVIEAVKQERRVARIVEVTVEPHVSERHLILISLTVQPAGAADLVTVGPLALEL